MSAELARHLLQTGNISADDVHAALLDVVTLGVPFVQALVSRGSMIGERLNAELSRLRVPTVHSISVSRELAGQLPAGMCARLLAVPVRRTEEGDVLVAAVDPLDSAVGAEFAEKLETPVQIVRAPLASVLLAIERWLDDRDSVAPAANLTPAFGTLRQVVPGDGGLGYAISHAMGGPLDEEAPDSSGMPSIPLVRRAVNPFRAPTNPGLGDSGSPSVVLASEETAEPVVPLSRVKPASGESHSVRVEPESTGLALARELDSSQVQSARSADELARALAASASAIAQSVLVLALRTGVHEVRASSSDLSGRLEAVRLASTSHSLADIAARDGHYLGRIPDDSLHAELRSVLGNDEVYAVPVLLSGRPTLTLVLAGFDASLAVTRAADQLVAVAGEALERIVRQKKRAT